jgi:membrane protease YdiL (CAAX protease family)
MPNAPVQSRLNVVLKVGVYALTCFLGMRLFALLLFPLVGQFAGAVLSVFLGALVANLISLRIYERAHLTIIGLYWNRASRRNLLLGLLGGMLAAYVVAGLPLLVGMAHLETIPGSEPQWRIILFTTGMLLFGAFGEEMLFRGYGFQVLLGPLGAAATVLPVGLLFGLAHRDNLNFSALGFVNTVLWGVLLGYAFLRSGDLWLPIGLHFGWNWVLPLFGANLSGFTMRLTGYQMRWHTGPAWSGGEYGPEASTLTTIAVGLLFVALAKAPILKQRPPLVPIDEDEVE